MTIRQSNEINELASALSVAQGELRDPEKDTQGYNYKYADLPSTLQTIRPVFHKNGLSFTQLPSGGDDNFVHITTRLMHTSGQWMESTFSMSIETKKGMSFMQCVGSTLTYARRYALQAVAGIAADEDTDHQDVRPDKDTKPATPKRKQRAPYRSAKDLILENKSKKELNIENKGNGEIEISLADELIALLESAQTKSDLDQVAKRAQDIADPNEKSKVRDVYSIRKNEIETVH
tara:strand:+ start:20771 stop:21472 length:702 start_codon:yes stop_codon:yes gene_type:complete